MASNMTAKEKVMHPVAAVKEMMHKGGSHTTDTTGTHTGTHVPGTHTGTHVPGTHTGTGHLSSADKEAGVIARYEVPAGTGVTHTGTHLPGTTHTGTHIPGTTHTGTHIPGTTHTGTHTSLTGTTHHTPLTGSTYTSPTTMGNEEQLMTNEMGLGGTPTMGTTAGTGARPVFSETGHQGVGPHQAKFGVDPASSAAAYEGKEHAGHLPGAGAVGMLGAAASKLMPGHHNKHADTGVAHTGTHGVGTTKNVL